MVARALILAAGKGVSIGGDAELSNCLTTVGRCSVIERSLELLEDLGVARIGITIGFSGAAVRRHIAESTVVSAATKRRVTFFENADWAGPRPGQPGEGLGGANRHGHGRPFGHRRPVRGSPGGA